MSWADDLVSTLRVASVLDPAIDRMASPVDEYAGKRDPSMVTPLVGHHITWAHLRPLSIEELIGIESAPTPAAKIMLAFRTAVESIDISLDISPTQALRPSQLTPHRGGPDRATWSAKDLDIVAREFGAEYVYEIGSVAYERAIQGKAWGGGASFTLPLSSVLGLQRIARRLAELAKQTSGTASNAEFATESAEAPSTSEQATAAGAMAPTEPAAAAL